MEEPIKEEPKIKKSFGDYGKIIVILLAVLVVAISAILVINIINLNDNEKPIKPIISYEIIGSVFLLNIQCEDNYNFVEVEVEFFDKDDILLDTFKMRTNNLEKNEFVQLKRNLNRDLTINTKFTYANVTKYE